MRLGSIQEHVERHWRTWLGQETPSGLDVVIFSRGAVSPARVTIFVFAKRERKPRLVLKVSFDEDSKFLAHEFCSLQQVRRIATPSLLDSIPAPLGFDRIDDMAVEAMTVLQGTQPSLPRLDGRTPYRGTQALQRYLSRIIDWSEALAVSTVGEEKSDERELSHVVLEFCTVFELTGRTRTRLDSFARAVENSDISWPRCWQHGDLTVGNVLYEGTKLRVLDWELSDGRLPPWFDAAYAWLALVLLHHHRQGHGSVVDVLPSLWSAGSWVGTLGRELVGEHWKHPLPLPWALVLVAMTAALRGFKAKRTGSARWVTLAKGMLDDDLTRKAVSDWAPHW